MRLLITYEKAADGQVGFKIKVADRGDFPRPHIFPSMACPEEFTLGDLNGEFSELCGYRTNYIAAERQVETIINMVMHHLTLWRRIGIPEDHSIEL